MANRGVLLQCLRAAVLRVVQSGLLGRCVDGCLRLWLYETSFNGEDWPAVDEGEEEGRG